MTAIAIRPASQSPEYYQPALSPSQAGSDRYVVIQGENGWSLQEKLLLGLLGTVVVGGAIYFGRKAIMNRSANIEENNSFEEGSSATVAKQIKMAFENDGWPGTDEEALRSALRQVPSKEEFEKVKKSYERLYSTPTKKAVLLRDMSDKLATTEYAEMLQIINGKPDKKGGAAPAYAYAAWAKRLKAAFDISYGFLPGTDANAIIAVFTEIPTQAAYVRVAIEYQKLYGQNLTEVLKDESEFGQYEEWMKIITRKPK